VSHSHDQRHERAGKIGPNLTRFGMRRGVGALAVEATQENVERWIHRPKDIKQVR
jgi:hypothetical protein